jgi:thiamine transport system substrate-binding protein
MNKKLLVMFFTFFLVSCAAGQEEAATSDIASAPEPAELTLMSHDSFAISEDVLAEFEEEAGVRIILLPAGDTGAALNQAILAKDNPLADLFFGVDNTFMSRALAEDIFEPYQTEALEVVPDALELDETHRLTPVDYGDVCLNYDIGWFEENDLDLPANLGDLTKPAYESLSVVENPATSSPGLAFLLTSIDTFGEEGDYTYLDFWRDMRQNDVMVVDGWEGAYYGQFSAASDGDRPLVVSYASSPPAEVVFADPPVDRPPTASITEPGTCFRQIEFVGILKGTQNREAAEKFVDFMLSERFQEDIPLNMFVFPANQEADLPEVFVNWADIPDDPATISPEVIDANREEWIEAWTDAVLR